jgi:hypothetical protein
MYGAILQITITESRFLILAANFNTMNCLLQYLLESRCGGDPCLPLNATACTEHEDTLK